jgi:WD40 repeat protein
MRLISDYHLITASTNGEISMWDTRFVSTRSISPASKSGSYAKPFMEIREPIRNYTTKTLFDINKEKTMLAMDNLEGQLSLWSLRTGERIRDLDMKGVTTCLKFSQNGYPGIWAIANRQLQFWGVDY